MGRKKILLGANLVQLPTYVWMFFMTNIYEAYAIFLIFGLCFGGSVSINTLYMQEFLVKRYRATIIAVIGTIEGFLVALLIA